MNKVMPYFAEARKNERQHKEAKALNPNVPKTVRMQITVSGPAATRLDFSAKMSSETVSAYCKPFLEILSHANSHDKYRLIAHLQKFIETNP